MLWRCQAFTEHCGITFIKGFWCTWPIKELFVLLPNFSAPHTKPVVKRAVRFMAAIVFNYSKAEPVFFLNLLAFMTCSDLILWLRNNLSTLHYPSVQHSCVITFIYGVSLTILYLKIFLCCCYYCYDWFRGFETGFHKIHIDFTLKLGMTLNIWSSLPVGITNMWHYAWFTWYCGSILEHFED